MEFEKIYCQYCQDVGLCTFCERGQQAIQEYQRNAKKADNVSPEVSVLDKKGEQIELEKINIVPVEERDDQWESLGYKKRK